MRKKGITKNRRENNKRRRPRGKQDNNDSDQSSELGGQGSDNDMRAEVDLNAISGSAGIFKAESIQEGLQLEQNPEKTTEEPDKGEKDLE